MTQSGIDPAVFRLLGQYLNQLCHRFPNGIVLALTYILTYQYNKIEIAIRYN